MGLKIYNQEINVLRAAQERISFAFDHVPNLYVSFSGGKDSTVMTHLVLEEAKRRGRKVGLLIIDLEAQYSLTIKHIEEMVELYKDHIELYWTCLPLALRNAVSNFEPRWICWDSDKKDTWVRDYPKNCIKDESFFPFFAKGMEFEEFMVEFGEWYSTSHGGGRSGAFVGIRCDESLNRFRTINSSKKETLNGQQFTTKVSENYYNVYPIYDWKVSDIWLYHKKFPEKCFNTIYDYMYRAGVNYSDMRLCQPYGDDQRRGLWLYHILEPDTWYKLIQRVNGVNSGALYIQENGNITGYNKISKPEHHTWESFCQLLLGTLPKKTQEHYIKKFIVFFRWWKKRGYSTGIPDEAPLELENRKLAPSWRRLCKVLLRNDYWCKGLNFTQPFSEVYGKYLKLKKKAQSQGQKIIELEQETEEFNDLEDLQNLELIK